MHGVTVEEPEGELSDVDPRGSVTLAVNRSRIRPPFSVLLATALYCAEFVAAAVLCSLYRKTDDVIWLGFTVAFMLLPALLIQLALTFIHRDLGRDRPMVLFLHLLLLGPVIRWVVARSCKGTQPFCFKMLLELLCFCMRQGVCTLSVLSVVEGDLY